jgi:hypothetical protein
MDPNSIQDHIYSREYLLKQGGTVPPHSTGSKKTLPKRVINCLKMDLLIFLVCTILFLNNH